MAMHCVTPLVQQRNGPTTGLTSHSSTTPSDRPNDFNFVMLHCLERADNPIRRAGMYGATP
jgi:hypothetical protein